MTGPALGSSSDAKRARILRAAREVCAQSGLEAARMDEIAAVAGVSKGTLYRFFPSKQDLLLEGVLDALAEAARAFDGSGDPIDSRPELVDRLEAMVRAFPVLREQVPLHLLGWGVALREPRARARMAAAYRALHVAREGELAEAVRTAQRRGQIRTDASPETLAASVVAVFAGMLHRAAFDPAGADARGLRGALDAVLGAPLLAPDASGPAPESERRMASDG